MYQDIYFWQEWQKICQSSRILVAKDRIPAMPVFEYNVTTGIAGQIQEHREIVTTIQVSYRKFNQIRAILKFLGLLHRYYENCMLNIFRQKFVICEKNSAINIQSLYKFRGSNTRYIQGM